MTRIQGGSGVSQAGQTLRPLRAACIGTSIYACDLRTTTGVTVDAATPGWAPLMDRGGEQAGGGRSWFTWACLLSGGRMIPWYNAGVSGDVLSNMVTRFAAEVVAKRPDIVFLGDATNDINQGVTDALIRGYVVTMITAAKAAGITPILVGTSRRNDTTAKNLRVREHNAWMQRYAWANGYTYIDPFAALVDPASTTGNVAAAYAADTVHPNVAGGKLAGQTALAALAGILKGNSDPSKSPFVAQERAAQATSNLWINPLATDDANTDGTADYWDISGTKSVVTDAAILGKAQQVVSAGTAYARQGFTVDGTLISSGDRLAWSGMAKVDAVSGSMQWGLKIEKIGGTGVYAACPIGYDSGGPVAVDLPWAAFYCEFVAPSDTTIIRAGIVGYAGTGTMSLAQMRLANLTKLGLDTLY